MRTCEQRNDLGLHWKVGRIYSQREKTTTNYVYANAVCNKCDVKYTFKINDEVKDTENYVKINVTTTSNHDDEIHKPYKKPQIRRQERVKTAERIMQPIPSKRKTVATNKPEIINLYITQMTINLPPPVPKRRKILKLISATNINKPIDDNLNCNTTF